jgi:hypothetical protein
MATGFPTTTGDILTAPIFNGLVTFTVGAAETDDYTPVLADQYQVLVTMNKATAVAFEIPTNASVAFPVGTAITVLNIGAGDCTITAVTSGTTTILSAGAVTADPVLEQYKSAVCVKTAVDTWYILGAVS